MTQADARDVGDGQCDDDENDVLADIHSDDIDEEQAAEEGHVLPHHHTHVSELGCQSQPVKQLQTFYRQMLWNIAMRQLSRGDWVNLARELGFTQQHIRAVSAQYTGALCCLMSLGWQSQKPENIRNFERGQEMSGNFTVS